VSNQGDKVHFGLEIDRAVVVPEVGILHDRDLRDRRVEQLSVPLIATDTGSMRGPSWRTPMTSEGSRVTFTSDLQVCRAVGR
jgi:hypothetical protein